MKNSQKGSILLIIIVILIIIGAIVYMNKKTVSNSDSLSSGSPFNCLLVFKTDPTNADHIIAVITENGSSTNNHVTFEGVSGFTNSQNNPNHADILDGGYLSSFGVQCGINYNRSNLKGFVFLNATTSEEFNKEVEEVHNSNVNISDFIKDNNPFIGDVYSCSKSENLNALIDINQLTEKCQKISN